MIVKRAMTAPGSSPRGRGKLQGRVEHALRVRLIPARAGKTYPRTTRRSGPRAHPRAGGENWVGTLGRSGGDGSSPRGRGKLAGWPGAGERPRLIPARAGKTLFAWRHWIVGRAYPRAGGENDPGSKETMALPGSSPRGRGKLRRSLQVQGHCRLIPARAGKMRLATKRAARSTAHPRAGGENMIDLAKPQLTAGSSPRGRGKRPHVLRRQHHRGLIPAWAGKTL